MKKLLLEGCLGALVLLCSFSGLSQVKNDFGVRYENKLKGDITLIGNNIVNRQTNGYWDEVCTGWFWNRHCQDVWIPGTSPNDPYSGNTANDNLNMHYIDVDGDPSTFSSSSANLSIPDPDCSQIRYAAIYWGAVYPEENRDDDADDHPERNLNQVKFRVPGGSYIDITADEILFDGLGDTDFGTYAPYAAFKDVTAIVAALDDPQGDYMMANILAGSGDDVTGGISGGWMMVVVYENPTLPGKFITTFDGYAGIKSGESADIPFTGFTTLPAPFPVNAKIGVATLEGDRQITGDQLSIQANSNASPTTLGNTVNPINNFFNSNVTIEDTAITTRNPNSVNTLGWDVDMFTIPNVGNNVIPNDETGATFYATSTQDKYDIFFTSLDVEIIEPQINLSKTVEDLGGNDITGLGVHLGQELDYVLTFQNVGNDDAVNYTIRDVLPINVTLNESMFTLPTGVTYTYDPGTRTVVFTIPDTLVLQGLTPYSIRMRVKVAENCFDFVDACTDIIQNLAYSTYRGDLNANEITDDPSVYDFDGCGFPSPGATNFLLDDLEACGFSRTVLMCGENVLLDAGDNFDNYIWYKDENGNGEIDLGVDTVITDSDSDGDPSTLLVNEVGTYLVDKQVADPCKDFQEVIIVELFGSVQSNPITAMINDPGNNIDGQILSCSNDGSELPEIFLCGLNDTELLELNIPDALEIVWEKLDEETCGDAAENCPNTNASCTWNMVDIGNDFVASDAGQYRVRINYQDGCFSRFYFNIYKNPLDPQYTSSDIICETPGNITVLNMPADYQFQLVDQTTGNIVAPYQDSPVFSVANNGTYRVQMIQDGVTDGCVFELENIGIRERDYQVNISSKNSDCSGLGEISIGVTNVEPQYHYSISQNGTLVDTYSPSTDNNYTFGGLNPGVYDVRVTTDDGCEYTEQVTVLDQSNLTAVAETTKNIDCTDGIITVTGSGGNPSPYYYYAIWSFNGTDLYADVSEIPAEAIQNTREFSFTNGQEGEYVFVVFDGNNCHEFSNAAVIEVTPAVEYTMAFTDESCFGANDGTFAITVTDAHGYTLSYALTHPDETISMNASGSFTGLGRGDYSLTVTQTSGEASCDFVETFTIDGPPELIVEMDLELVQDYTCLQEGIIGVRSVSGGTAPYQYSIDGVTFVPDSGTLGEEDFSDLTAGTYSITVRDANGCAVVTHPITIDPLDPPTDIAFTATDPQCPAFVSDVTLSVTGGSPDLVYEIIAPATSAHNNGNSPLFTSLAPDTYLFRVTDSKGCTYEESYTINTVSIIAVSGQAIHNISCVGAEDGEATFTVTNFNTSFDYTISGPSNSNGTGLTNGSIPLTGLAAGDYTIVVTDTMTQCPATTTVTIEAPTAELAVSHTLTQPTCEAVGSVNIMAADGWGSYTYEIVSGPAGYTLPIPNGNGQFSNLVLEGTYTYTVTDANGCLVTGNFEINEAVPPVLEIEANDLCYDDAIGLTLTAVVTSDGDGDFEYSLNGGSFGPNNVFTGLNPGTHTIEVRDGNDCFASASITIDPELSVVASAPNITACADETIVTISAAGGDGNYVYAVVPSGNTPTDDLFSATNPVSGIVVGNYNVYVRDHGGVADYCEAVFPLAIVKDPALEMDVTTLDNLCSGDAQGQIVVSVTGGEAPYTYSINGGTFQTSNTFGNLAAGSYEVRVRDANGCELSEPHTITEPYTLSASAAVTALVECNPTDGAEVRITNAIGGTAPYQYSFNGGTSYGSNPIGYLLPGTHTVYIRDVNGCTFPMEVIVDPAPTPPTVVPDIAYDCEGEGIITLSPNSTDFDYTYMLDGTPNTPVDSNTFNNVPAGTHTITVEYISNTPPAQSILLTEDFGFGVTTSIDEVDPNFCFEPLEDGTPEGCDRGGVGNLVNGEYTVTQEITGSWSGWRSPRDQTLGRTDGRFLAIDLGTVAGLDGIIYAKRDIEIIPNTELTISMSLYNLVRAELVGTQVDPNVKIQLLESSTGEEIIFGNTGEIPRNTHEDDWHERSITLDPGNIDRVDIVIRTYINTDNGNDLAIDNIQAFQVPEVCPGSFTLDIHVEDGHAFEAGLTGHTDISCSGGNDGSISFEVENFDPTAGYTYSLNGVAVPGIQTNGTVDLTGLTAGSYTIRVVDQRDTSCFVEFTQDLTQPNAVQVDATVDELTCTNGGGTLTATASGGTPTYEYQLEDDSANILVGYQTDHIFTGLTAGVYIIRAKDSNGCEDVSEALTISVPETIEFDLLPTACYGGNNDGSIQVDITNGNEGYKFRLNGGGWITPIPVESNTHIFNGLAAGTYTIDVMDGYGCIEQDTVTIVDALVASVEVVDISTCADGSITVTASGGSPTLEYAFVDTGIDPDGTFIGSNVFTVVLGNEGTYDVYVRDNSANNPYCEFMETVIVNPPTPLTMDVTPTDPDCHDGTGSILVEITSGIAPYTIQIVDLDNGGTSNQTATNVLTTTRTYYNLQPGSYDITVTDATGCDITDTQIINNPDELVGNVDGITPANCTGDMNEFGFSFENYPTTLGTIQFSDDGGVTWDKDNSNPGTSDQFTGYISGQTVYPSMRTVDGSNNTVCQTDLPPFIIPYPLDDLDITILPIVVNCNELQVTVRGQNGTGPYEYTYSEDPANFNPATAIWTTPLPLGTTHTFEHLVPGRTYTFYVRDAATCIRQSSVNVNDIITVPVEITSEVKPTCYGLETGSITYTIIDNEIPFETQFRWTFYDMSTGSAVPVTDSGGIVSFTTPQQDVTIDDLPAGNYFIEVTMVDGLGVDSCVGATENVLLEELDPLSGTLNVLRDISCAEPGLIQVQSPFGGGGTYTYTVTGPAGFTTITTTTDNPIEIPANSPAGAYTVEMADQYTCTMPLGSVNLELTPNPTIGNIVVDNCTIPATVTIQATSGSSQIFYSIDGGATYLDNGGVFNNVYPGTYNVSIKDGNGCVATDTVTVYPLMEASVELTKLLDCSPSPEAQITIDVLNGSGSYDYEIADGSGTIVTRQALVAPLVFPTLVAGDYTIIVHDNNLFAAACPRTFDVTVPPIVMPVFSIDAYTNATCADSDDGTIRVSAVENGTGPFTFEITAGPGSTASFPILPTSNTLATATFTALEGLEAGITYTIEITAANGCKTTLDQLILEPAPIAAIDLTVEPFVCVVGNNGNHASITVNSATGGTGTYVRYEFINNDGNVVVQNGSNNTYIETNTAGGDYTINLYDSNGCVGTTTATIDPFDAITDIEADITTDLSCAPGGDGVITIDVTSTAGDPTAFEYSDDNGASWQDENYFVGLGAGNHLFFARHKLTGCMVSVSETILDPNTFTIDVDVVSHVDCYGSATGEISFSLIDATYPIAGGFNWTIYNTNGTPVDTSDDVFIDSGTSTTVPVSHNGLSVGSYRLVIVQDDFPECTNETAFTINGPSAVLAATTTVTEITCDQIDNGIIDVHASGGWGDYGYFVDLTSAPVPVDSDYVTDTRFENLVAGDYTIWIKDQSGCIITRTETLVNPDPITATLQINDDNCAAFEGEIEVVGTAGGQGSNYSYQLIKDGTNVGSPQNTAVFSGLGAGSYEVQIQDQWGCDLLVGPVVLYDVMTAVTTVVEPIKCDPNVPGDIVGGQVRLNVMGGSSSYNFQVVYPDSSTPDPDNDTGVFIGLDQAGIYTFIITDNNTNSSNCEIIVTQELDFPVSPVIDEVHVTNVSCNAGSDGVLIITLAPTSDTDPKYTYELYAFPSETQIGFARTTPEFDGLAAGEYRVRVKSARACFDDRIVRVEEPDPLTATAKSTPFTCNVNNDVSMSTITLTGDGGTEPYKYKFENGGFSSSNTFNVFDIGSDQTINYWVRDANGCVVPGTIEIQPLNTFELNLSEDTAIGCGNDGLVTLSVVNERIVGATYSFELLPVGNANGLRLDPIVSDTSAQFELYNPGNYTFKVTNDTTGCYELIQHEILPFDLIDVVAVATLPAVCYDAAGTLAFTVSGNAGAYAYEVFRSDHTLIGAGLGSGNGTQSFTHADLVGGNYFVRVTQTDHPDCLADSNVITIVSPNSPLTVTATEVANVTCTNDLGEILVSPSGGYAPYAIELTHTTDPAQTYSVSDVSGFVFGGLSAGDYLVRVVDAQGCEFLSNVGLEGPLPIMTDINVSPANLLCFGDTNGSVWADIPSGGSGSYLYRLNRLDGSGNIISSSAFQSGPTFIGLGAGTYSITVTDGWGCDTNTGPVTITEPVEVLASLIQVEAMSCTEDAELLLTASGGTAPYTYSVDGITYLPMAGGNTQSFDVTPGIYQYYVRDVNGCDANISNQIEIDPVPALTIALDTSAAMINCTGEATASIRATATGGLGNYSYELYGDAGFTQLVAPAQPRGTFGGLVAGEYYVRVSSGDCVEGSPAVIIVDPQPLVIVEETAENVSCSSMEDGSIHVLVTGGTGEIQYAISPNLNQFSAVNTFTNLAAGTYQVIAQDANGCFETFEFEITQPDPITATAINVEHEVCYQSGDGSFEIQVVGGTAPYWTALDSNVDTAFVEGRFAFSDLSTGTHVVFVRDAEGCETTVFVEIEPGVDLSAKVTPIYECTGNIPGNYLDVVLDDPGMAVDVMYALDSTDPASMKLVPEYSNLAPGEHYISVMHANGCMATYSFTIEAYEPLVLSLENNSLNQITAVATGGVEAYTYFFGETDHGTNNTFYINRTGTYTVRVVDQNGCEALAEIYLEFIDIGMPNFFTPDGDGLNDTWIPDNLQGFPDVLIRIYDRYGRVVEEMTRDTQGWDGKYENKPLPTGDYWYIVQLNGANDDREFVGHFTLYRQ